MAAKLGISEGRVEAFLKKREAIMSWRSGNTAEHAGRKIMTETKERTCQERVAKHYESRIEDLRALWAAYQSGDEEVEDLGTFNEYGLCFDYVAVGTFTDQEEGYFRYQISYGGPSEEFRFYTDAELNAHTIKFWFLDWGDGAFKHVTDDDEPMMLEIWEFFVEIGSVEAELAKATA